MLDLKGSKEVGDDCLKIIGINCKKLRILDITGCCKVTDTGIQWLCVVSCDPLDLENGIRSESDCLGQMVIQLCPSLYNLCITEKELLNTDLLRFVGHLKELRSLILIKETKIIGDSLDSLHVEISVDISVIIRISERMAARRYINERDDDAAAGSSCSKDDVSIPDNVSNAPGSTIQTEDVAGPSHSKDFLIPTVLAPLSEGASIQTHISDDAAAGSSCSKDDVSIPDNVSNAPGSKIQTEDVTGASPSKDDVSIPPDLAPLSAGVSIQTQDVAGPSRSRAATFPQYPSKRKRNKLDLEHRLAVVRLHQEHWSGPRLAQRFGCSVDQIYGFWNNPDLQPQQPQHQQPQLQPPQQIHQQPPHQQPPQPLQQQPPTQLQQQPHHEPKEN
uniref:Uncharacterized protein n=1 Tax=Daphnia galeata TaxID=27404 RepID=A0A8J2WJM0_9CRUS|nr:unnamed protein product [Daphnia galeata]